MVVVCMYKNHSSHFKSFTMKKLGGENFKKLPRKTNLIESTVDGLYLNKAV